MYYIDTETCGLHGLPVLLQYARDDGPIVIHDIWSESILETLLLIEKIMEEGIIGFNLAFDQFHLCKIYTTFLEYCKTRPMSDIPEEHIDEMAICEKEARLGPCVKPKHALDLMLHARKGPFQSLMSREKIRVRRVPSVLAWQVRAELEKRVKLDSIFFERRADKYAPQWTVYDCKKQNGDVDPNFKDVVLNFAPSTSLKALAHYALGLEEDQIIKFFNIALPKKAYPEEVGYAPFALAIGSPGNWNGAWPEKIKFHIDHWAYNERARTYASNDIEYTRGLYKYFKCPAFDDDDSVLACAVAAIRWSGYAIDVPAVKAMRDKAKAKADSCHRAPARVRAYVCEPMSPVEKLVIQGSTKKTILVEITKWKLDDGTDHPSASRAKEVLAARKAVKEVEIYDKLLLAGRFHASFNIIGALSTRMSGADGLNPQGIQHSKEVRALFTLADPDFSLCGGDFDSFELGLTDAVYGDPVMRSDLQNKKFKIHALMGSFLFGKTYDEVLATKGQDPDLYSMGKQGVFALVYFGEAHTLETKLNVPEEKALEAYTNFLRRYREFAEKRKRVTDRFCSMRQEGGIGTKVTWADPAEYSESLFGFKRYFTIENRVCKALFDLANHPPKHWRNVQVKVQRRERIQTASGAVQSSLYASSFGLQGACMRAAGNHEIQSSGAHVTKHLQRRIWDLQPTGIHPFDVKPMNIHDEVLAPTRKGLESAVRERVHETVESFRPKVPLIEMEWKEGMGSWAEK